jgi:acetylornithine deacetylase/succinyl-diaminopimelate desuccinylase-like protein
MDAEALRAKVGSLLPEVLDDLERMVAIPSCAFPGYPPEPVLEMAAVTVELCRAAGFEDARAMDVPEGYPPVYAEVPGPAGSPVVTLYAHYDIQPAPPSQGWTTDPWTLTRKDDGRLCGRGAADDKGGLAIHLGTLRALDGMPPCTVRLIVEGMEETASNLPAFVRAHPDLFACDLFVVCDMGNLRVGEPALTTTLRGEVACLVTVRTAEHPLHSGVFGGAAPDATIALARLLATLHDDDGRVAVEGLTRATWDGPEVDAQEFRASADLLSGTDVLGRAAIGARLWAEPSVTAIGLDATSIAGASNVLHHEAGAKLSMRIVPGADPETELDALVRLLETHAPWGATVEVERVKTAPPFRVRTDGPGFAAARAALREAYGVEPASVGSGGSIPLMQTLAEVAPGAEFVLWGPEDMAASRIHASDESVDPEELASLIVAQALLLDALAGARTFERDD